MFHAKCQKHPALHLSPPPPLPLCPTSKNGDFDEAAKKKKSAGAKIAVAAVLVAFIVQGQRTMLNLVAFVYQVVTNVQLLQWVTRPDMYYTHTPCLIGACLTRFQHSGLFNAYVLCNNFTLTAVWSGEVGRQPKVLPCEISLQIWQSEFLLFSPMRWSTLT